MIKENVAVYDYHVDMRENKWRGEKKLKITDKLELPEYLQQNIENYKEWIC